jgi:hypothetical protein
MHNTDTNTPEEAVRLAREKHDKAWRAITKAFAGHEPGATPKQKAAFAAADAALVLTREELKRAEDAAKYQNLPGEIYTAYCAALRESEDALNAAQKAMSLANDFEQADWFAQAAEAATRNCDRFFDSFIARAPGHPMTHAIQAALAQADKKATDARIFANSRAALELRKIQGRAAR